MEEKSSRVEKEELLFELRLLAEGMFDAEIEEVNGALAFTFANGQKFFVETREFE